MKKKLLLSSIATIAVCLSLIAGSTFAIFTSKSQVNIAINAANVEMKADVTDLTRYSVRPATEVEKNAELRGEITLIEDQFGGKYVYADPSDTFANGGTAEFTNGTLTLNYITPGDKVTFNLKGYNTSNVTVQYRYIIKCTDGVDLMGALRVTIGERTYEYLGAYTSPWATLAANTDMPVVPVAIEFPVDAGDYYQNKSTAISVTVEAVQGNADVAGLSVATIEFAPEDIDLAGKNILLDGVVNGGTVALSNGTIDVEDVGFENFGDATFNNITLNAGTPGVQGYGYGMIAYANSTTTLNNVNLTSDNGAIAVVNKDAELVFNSGSVILNSANTSGRYVFYVEGTGHNVTINGGTFDIPNAKTHKRAYVYVDAGSTVTINGGDFGKASERKGYTTPFLGSGEVIVKGGSFSFNPTAWVADGYKAVKIGAKWQVVAEDIAVVFTAEEFAEAVKGTGANISVMLANDIEVPMGSLGSQTPGSGEYKLGGDATDSIVIDLNGKKLTITTTYMSAIGAKNAEATITIKNGSMNSTGNASTTWNINDLIFANCNYVFENVTFEKEVALTNTGKAVDMKNVTINGTGNYYALWIQAEGQTVTIDGLTVNTPGRGIKIDEQYSNENVAKVTLNVSNADFNTEKKAAILVKTVAGADIVLNNVNIENTADAENAVWNDADSAAYYDLVTVVGGNKVQEN